MEFGGLTGRVGFRGPVRAFADYLDFAHHVHIGKQTSFGLGQCEFVLLVAAGLTHLVAWPYDGDASASQPGPRLPAEFAGTALMKGVMTRLHACGRMP